MLRILDFFGYKLGKSLHAAILYSALIAGSVFWINYANSRNLEVAGGLAVVYLALLISRKSSWKSKTGLLLLTSLLFFADPLQIYMTFVPLLAWLSYGWWTNGRQRKNLVNVATIASLGLAGIVIAQLLVRLCSRVWNVTIADAAHPSSQSLLSSLPNYIGSTAKQFGRLYSGGNELGHFVEALNILFAASVILTILYMAYKSSKLRPVVIFAGIFWIIDTAAYIASAQASQPDTSRYLIMTVPMFVVVLALVIYEMRSRWLPVFCISLVIGANILALSTAVVQKWDPGFSPDDHATLAYSYLRRHNYKYGYAGMNTGMAGYYLSGFKNLLLPLGCQPDSSLRQADLFYDSAQFAQARSSQVSLAPVIFDGSNITNIPSVCTPADLQKQIGAPQSTDYLTDGSSVLIFKTSQLAALKR